MAKLASEAAKPRVTPQGPRPGAGVVVVAPGEELGFIQRLPARALWGVGPKTLARLERLGVSTVGDIAALPVETLVRALGDAHGRHLHALAHARDDRPVEPDQRPKSIGHEETFPHDIHQLERLAREVVRMADGVALRLRRARVAGRTVVLKVRFGDFRTITRSATLPMPVDDAVALSRAAQELLETVDPTPGVRLLGVTAANLVDAGDGRQLSFDDLARRPWHDASGAVEEIRERFGDDAIGPASTVGPDGLRTKRRGQDPWGPS